MANPELIRVMDYILNRCDEASIEVLAAAVVRRRRDLAMTGGGVAMPDPQRMAKELSAQINGSIGSGVKGLRDSIRDMAVRVIRQEAPELTDAQIAELTRSWIGGEEAPRRGVPANESRGMVASMIDQFVSYSRGTMSKAEDAQLRAELGSWPERYWKSFSAVLRSIIGDYLKDNISEQEFNSKIGIALEM